MRWGRRPVSLELGSGQMWVAHARVSHNNDYNNNTTLNTGSFLDWSLSSLRSTALKNLTNRLAYQNDYTVESLEYREIMLADILDKMDRRLGGG